MECGAVLGSLAQHLKVHALRPKEYRRRWEYSRNSPLCSVKLSQRKSARLKRTGFQPPQATRLGMTLGPPSQSGTKALQEGGWRLEAREKRR
ncbi:MAG: MucR family transcriptional regulator, partial [Proteobacteria bacterium]|nr:MucR family transcriptional regulator [Pseudomonadota bacterium]